MDHADIQRETYLAAIKAPGLNVLPVAWTSTVKPAAAHKAVTLTKRVSATVIVGAEYRNLAVNNDRETGALPWGTWVKDAYPWLIEHKGSTYARLYTVDDTVKATYYVDGREVRKADFDAYLTPAARESRRPKGGTITVKLDNLTIL